MNKRVEIILEIIIVFSLLIYYSVKVVIPDYIGNIGSSDKYIFNNNYVNYIEININNNINYSFLINENQIVTHLFFFDNNSTCLYNKNIENKNIDTSINKMISILKEERLLNDQSSINVFYTSNDFIDKIINILKDNSSNVVGSLINISDKAKEYSINSTDPKRILFDLDLYSKELVKKNKTINKIDSSEWEKASDEIYKKLMEYIKNEEIHNLNKEDVLYPINLIPANNYYPSENSWYYVKDDSLYAYIEFKNKNVLYSYCYKGTITNKTKGACD